MFKHWLLGHRIRTLIEQIAEIEDYLRPWLTNNDVFPLILGGEHGLLPIQMKVMTLILLWKVLPI